MASLLRFNSIKLKLLLAFGAFSLMIFAIFGLWEFYNRKVLEIEQTYYLLNEVNLKIAHAATIEKDFFLLGTHNLTFYKTGKNPFLQKHSQLFSEVKDLLFKIRHDEISDENVHRLLETTTDEIALLETTFAQVLKILREKGFEDYGLEGKLRKDIHFIEEHFAKINLVLVLNIRRHEKDYFLRKDEKYAQLVNAKTDMLRYEIIKKEQNEQAQKNMLSHLESYRSSFNQIVEMDKKLGMISDKKGLRAELDKLSDQIDLHITNLDKIILHRIEDLSTQLHYTFGVVFFIVLLANVALVFFIVNKLGKPIEMLSASIHKTIESNFSNSVVIHEINSDDEIGILSKDFAIMLHTVRTAMNEIRMANEDLLQKNEEINQQNEEIHAIAENLRVIGEEIDKKNKNITASINYAKRIQNAILPRPEQMSAVLHEHFVFFNPRDIVSGDLYWFQHERNKTLLAAIDCTGHGVPGAIMSVIADALLREAVFSKHLWSPDEILTEMNKQIALVLRPSETKIRDGMDISICVIDHQNAILEYSGAKSPIYYLQYTDGQKAESLEAIKGSIHPIGGNYAKYVPHFPKHRINLRSNNPDEMLNTIFYLFSDGYEDQFGGKEGRKFLSRRFRDLLFDMHLLPMKKQHHILNATIQDWMSAKYERQLDDLLVIGVKLRF